MKHVVNHMARGKSPRSDNILIDTIKDRNNVINKDLTNIFSACLKKGNVSQQ